MARDVRERGRTPESVEHQYFTTVRPMAEQYIWPTRRHADLVIRGDALLEESVATPYVLREWSPGQLASNSRICGPVSGSW